MSNDTLREREHFTEFTLERSEGFRKRKRTLRVGKACALRLQNDKLYLR